VHLGESVVRFLCGDKGRPQPVESATYACTRLPADGEIDWSASTDSIDALIRGLVKPFPGAFTYLEGRRIVIWRARPVEQPLTYSGRVPGRVVNVARERGEVDVLTGDGVLRLVEVESENDRPSPAAAVIRSVRATLGLRPAELLSRIAALEHEIECVRERLLTSGEKNVLV
jgi:methionyl-tRNA formyltransferase